MVIGTVQKKRENKRWHWRRLVSSIHQANTGHMLGIYVTLYHKNLRIYCLNSQLKKQHLCCNYNCSMFSFKNQYFSLKKSYLQFICEKFVDPYCDKCSENFDLVFMRTGHICFINMWPALTNQWTNYKYNCIISPVQ